MTVRGYRIEDEPPYKNPRSLVNPQIMYGQSFAEWQAVIACGATLSELLAWDEGRVFPPRFRAKVRAFHWIRQKLDGYVEDARIVKPKKGK